MLSKPSMSFRISSSMSRRFATAPNLTSSITKGTESIKSTTKNLTSSLSNLPILPTNISQYPRIFGIRDYFLNKQREEEIASDPLLEKLKRKEPINVTVTGSAGNIGYAVLFRIANGELLGPNQPVSLRCLELPEAMNALKGVEMELEDCAFPLLKSVVITDDPHKAFEDSDIALLIGSKPRLKGMERGDLLRDNGEIFQSLGQVIDKVANKHIRISVVGNPCNTNCLILSEYAHSIPRQNFTAMTRLDHDRAISILARKTTLPTNEINFFAIWGNHSSTMFPDLRYTTIHGVPWNEVIGEMRADRFWKNEFIPKVQQRGAHIINVRGSSSAASAANACIAHTRDWILGSKQPDWTSMGVISKGEYGVPSGLVFSYPVWCKNGAYQIASYPSGFSEFQQYMIELTIRELEDERDTVASLLP